jgi:hypothetical protein
MGIDGTRKFGVSNRSLMLVVPLCALLLASGIWNVRQYRLAHQQRLQTVAAEREAKAETARAEADAKLAKLKKKAADIETGARVDQLYQEINNLTRMSEQVLLRDRSFQGTPAKKDGRGEATGLP